MSKKKFAYMMMLAMCSGCCVEKSTSMCDGTVKSIDGKNHSINDLAGKHKDITQFTDPKTNLIGFRDKNGKVILPPKYPAAVDFNVYGVSQAFEKKDNAWYTIDTNGKHLLKPYFFDNGPDYYVSDLSRFEENGKLGFANVKGEVVIPAQFDWVSGFWFSKPIALACMGCKSTKAHENDEYPSMKGGSWGAIDKNGNIVIPFDFTDYDVDEDHTITLFKNNSKYKVCLGHDNTFKVIEK